MDINQILMLPDEVLRTSISNHDVWKLRQGLSILALNIDRRLCTAAAACFVPDRSPMLMLLQEVREGRQGSSSQALAFACPMCEHARGGVSNFACPPSPGETLRT